MDFVATDSAASLADSKPLSKVEVSVIGLDDSFAILEIKSMEFAHSKHSLTVSVSSPSGRLQERIFWPRNKLEQQVQISDTLMLELKKSEVTAIKNLVENAKKEHHDNKNFGAMRKLLEELIN